MTERYDNWKLLLAPAMFVALLIAALMIDPIETVVRRLLNNPTL